MCIRVSFTPTQSTDAATAPPACSRPAKALAGILYWLGLAWMQYYGKFTWYIVIRQRTNGYRLWGIGRRRHHCTALLFWDRPVLRPTMINCVLGLWRHCDWRLDRRHSKHCIIAVVGNGCARGWCWRRLE